MHEKCWCNSVIADADPGPVDCFVCGKPMTCVLGSVTYRCHACGVSELRHRDVYIPLTRTVTSLTCPDGEVIPFIDHSVEHWPSPA